MNVIGKLNLLIVLLLIGIALCDERMLRRGFEFIHFAIASNAVAMWMDDVTKTACKLLTL